MKSNLRYITILIIISLILTGCGFSFKFSSSSSEGKMKGTFTSLTGTKTKSYELKEGDTITIDYEIEVKEGTLTAAFIDSSGNEIVSFKPNTSGKIDIEIEKNDTYEIVVKGSEADGSYNIDIELK